MEEKQFTYLIEAYKIAISYTDSFSNRMYSRFNILLTLDVALGGVITGLLGKSSSTMYIICALGLILSVILYLQSAQDKFILKQNITRVNAIRKIIEFTLKRDDIPALFSPLDATDTGASNFTYENIFSWRSNRFSVTRIPVILSFLFIVFWSVVLLII